MAISGQAHATGVPTGDAGTRAALAQQYLVLKDQFDTLKQSYETQSRTLDSLKGSYGRGAIGLNDAMINLPASVVPGSWQEVAVKARALMAASSRITNNWINTLPQELFNNPQGQRAQNYQLSS